MLVPVRALALVAALALALPAPAHAYDNAVGLSCGLVAHDDPTVAVEYLAYPLGGQLLVANIEEATPYLVETTCTIVVAQPFESVTHDSGGCGRYSYTSMGGAVPVPRRIRINPVTGCTAMFVCSRYGWKSAKGTGGPWYHGAGDHWLRRSSQLSCVRAIEVPPSGGDIRPALYLVAPGPVAREVCLVPPLLVCVS